MTGADVSTACAKIERHNPLALRGTKTCELNSSAPRGTVHASLGLRDPLSRRPHGQNYFHRSARSHFSFCPRGVKVMMGKPQSLSSDPGSRPRQRKQPLDSSPFKNYTFYLRMPLIRNNILKFYEVLTLFSTFSVSVWQKGAAHGRWWDAGEKRLLRWTVRVSHGRGPHTTLLQPACLADIFSKMNEVSLLLKENNWQYLTSVIDQ